MIEEYNTTNQISNSDNTFTGNNTFTGINTFNDDGVFKKRVRIFDSAAGFLTLASNISQSQRRLFYDNPSSGGSHNFWCQGSNCLTITNNNITLRKSINGVPDITFLDGTIQTTAFSQTEFNALKFKTSAITYINIPEVPNVTPGYESYIITSDNVSIAGNFQVNGHNINTEIANNAANIATNTANIATNTANIATNTANILALEAMDHSILTTDLNCAGFDLLNVGEINSTDIVSNHILTEDLKIVSVGAGPETIIQTTTNSGICTMDVSSFSTNSQLDIITYTDLGASKNFSINNERVAFDGRDLTGFKFPTRRSMAVRITYDTFANEFILYRNSAYAPFFVNYASTSYPIRTIGTGNFEIYINDYFYGGDGGVMVYDLATHSTGLYTTNGSASSIIFVSAPQFTLETGVGCKCEFLISRGNNPDAACNLLTNGYITIEFSIPWV
jgi:hypothetical protein